MSQALARILRAQDNVISRRQALACGLTSEAVVHRIRPGGPWQRLLYGIYLAQTGPPAVVQKEMAALLHGGPGSVLTGAAALRGLGLTTAEPRAYDVLIPLSRRPGSVAFVVTHRTARIDRGRRRGSVRIGGGIPGPDHAGATPHSYVQRPAARRRRQLHRRSRCLVA
jgi:hypothetical protein